MKITALVENRSEGELQAEHGLSVLIEYEGKTYLLDSGSTAMFSRNAEKMGISLSGVDAGILSHAHYDHSGGYDAFFEQNHKAKIYLRDKATSNCYAKKSFIKKYIGIPKGLLERYPDRFVHVSGDYNLSDGVWLIPHKGKDLTLRAKSAHMYRKIDGKFVIDDFLHEQSLVFEVNDGIVILNSCCHGGVDTVVEEVKSVFPGKEVLAVVGGFHLMGLLGAATMGGPSEEVEALGKRLLELGVQQVYTGHCTGMPAFEVLAGVLGERIHYFSTGCSAEF